jgi:hypothetical protein
MRRFFAFILFFLLYLSSSIYFYKQVNAKMYNFLGRPLSYGMAAFMVCIALSVITILLVYLAKRKRTVA